MYKTFHNKRHFNAVTKQLKQELNIKQLWYELPLINCTDKKTVLQIFYCHKGCQYYIWPFKNKWKQQY